MRRTYSTLLYLAVPFVVARLAWRGWSNRAYLTRFSERFGFGPPVSPRGDASETFWIHAVSVGEVQAGLPLVRGIRDRFPRARVVVTTTTPTGTDRVRLALGTEVIHRYLPYDLPGAVRRFLARTEPAIAIMVETEIWPNLIAACTERGIPVVLANARLSAGSARAYRRFGRLFGPAFSQLTSVCAQTRADASRFVEIGVPPRKVVITGSTKFDVTVSASISEAGQVLRRCWGVDRSVWIAASTHEGEEEMVLDAFARVRREVPTCLLAVVPRHPERFAKVASLVRRRGFTVALRSEGERPYAQVDVFVGDTMGELPIFYAASDLAFVGGSLVEVGGHNMLEPAALGVPVLLGPHLRNFLDISGRLCAEGAAEIVEDAGALAERAVAYLHDANRRHGAGERGRDFVRRNRGAGRRLVDLVAGAARIEARASDPSIRARQPTVQ